MGAEGIRRGRGRPKKIRTLTDDLREQTRARVGFCTCCGRPLASIRGTAAEIGIHPSILSSFLRGVGGDLSAHNMNQVHAWLQLTDEERAHLQATRAAQHGSQTRKATEQRQKARRAHQKARGTP